MPGYKEVSLSKYKEVPLNSGVQPVYPWDEEVEEQPEVRSIPKMAAKGALQEFAMGYGPTARMAAEMPEPETTGEKVAYGAGSLVGMIPSFAATSLAMSPVSGVAAKAPGIARLIKAFHGIGKGVKTAAEAERLGVAAARAKKVEEGVEQMSRLGLSAEHAIHGGLTLGAHSAARQQEGGIKERAISGVKAVPMGLAFGASGMLPGGAATHIASAGAIGAGFTAAEGGTTEDILIQGGLLSALSALGIGTKKAKKLVRKTSEEIDKLPPEERDGKIDEFLSSFDAPERRPLEEDIAANAAPEIPPMGIAGERITPEQLRTLRDAERPAPTTSPFEGVPEEFTTREQGVETEPSVRGQGKPSNQPLWGEEIAKAYDEFAGDGLPTEERRYRPDYPMGKKRLYEGVSDELRGRGVGVETGEWGNKVEPETYSGMPTNADLIEKNLLGTPEVPGAPGGRPLSHEDFIAIRDMEKPAPTGGFYKGVEDLDLADIFKNRDAIIRDSGMTHKDLNDLIIKKKAAELYKPKEVKNEATEEVQGLEEVGSNLRYETGGDALGREYHGYIAAIDKATNKSVGKVDYSYLDGDTAVKMIEVLPEYRRKGIATELLNRLQQDSESPIRIQGNYATPEGQALWNKVRPSQETLKDPKDMSLDELTAEMDRITTGAEDRRASAKDESIKMLRPAATDWMTPEEIQRHAEIAPWIQRKMRDGAAERVAEKRAKRLSESPPNPPATESPLPEVPVEAERGAVGDVGKGKEPWEMTRDEFANDRIGEGAADELPSDIHSLPKEQMTQYPIGKVALEHYDSVQKAVNEGKPVSQDVLADYPDLAKQSFEKAFYKTYQEGKPETIKASTDKSEAEAKKPNGWVHYKGQQLPFVEYRVLQKGSNKGKIGVIIRGKEKIVSEKDIAKWPEEKATESKPKGDGSVTLGSGLGGLQPYYEKAVAKVADALSKWKETSKIPFVTHKRIDPSTRTKDTRTLRQVMDDFGVKGERRQQVIRTIVGRDLGEGNVKLTDLTKEEQALVKNFLDNASTDVYGKVLLNDIEDFRGVTLAPKFIDNAPNLKDIPQWAIEPITAWRVPDMVDSSGETYKHTIIPYEDANHAFRVEKDAANKDLRSLISASKGSKLSAQLQDYAEGKIPIEQVSPKYREEVQKAAAYTRAKYDEWLERVNQARALVGKQPIVRRNDYFTHGQEISELSAFFGGANKIPNEIAKASQFTHPNSPFFKYEKRLGGQYVADGVGNFLKYADNALKVIHFTPALVEAKAYIRHLPPNAHKVMQTWADETMASKVSHLDRLWDETLGVGSRKAWTWARSRMVKNIVLGSARILFQQPSTFAQTFAELSTGKARNFHDVAMNISDSFEGFKNAFTPAGKQILQFSKEYRDRMYIDDIDPTLLNKAEKALSYANAHLDRFMVANAYLGKYRQLTRQGMEHSEAIIEADKFSKRTQASYQKGNLNAILRSEMGKNVLPLQTFTFNLMNHMAFDVPKMINERGKAATFAYGLTLLAGMAAVNGVYESLHMTKTWDWMSVIPGLGYIKYGASGPLGIITNLAKLAFGDDRQTGDAKMNLKKVPWQIIPPFGGEQMRKSIDGYLTLQDPHRKPYEMKGDMDRLMAVVFGPGSTEAGREYWKERDTSFLDKITGNNDSGNRRSRSSRRARRARD